MTEQSEWQFIVDYLKDDTTDFYNALSDEQKAELHCTGFSELDSMMAQWLV